MGLWHNWKWFVHFRKSGQIPARLIPAVMRTKAVIPLGNREGTASRMELRVRIQTVMHLSNGVRRHKRRFYFFASI